ncbi:dihydrolipoyl dehydrogenase [Croceicoccus gelatinilyticus]|uniref:dihydrolipoyl dehydrogenase n=1 Tax=Croceicoccus gelatinilyticus TaxID=2835536 RepID=UPI001BCD736B|nr:dihydrolipoyl dehydrogenase [Croceicoccus gelatinilyticus]MBS7670652.1 dihydrolipoyl dehydrogenase [Croceicoccus gelatinilyticus]
MNSHTHRFADRAIRPLKDQFDFDVAIIGAGTAGMSAYREASRYTDRIALIDGGPLGTTCARVGCMPSKLLIAAAEAAEAGRHAAMFGVTHGPAIIDGKAIMNRVRSERDRFVGFVEQAIMAFDRCELIREYARFEDNHTLRLSSGRTVTARTVVIASGSSPVIPYTLQAAGDRLIVNDDVFDWHDLPGSVAVMGTGVIGLELGQALHRLGVRVRLFGRRGRVGMITDPVVRDYAAKCLADENPMTWDVEPAVSREGDKVVLNWGPSAEEQEQFDFVIAAAGRRPNVAWLGLENTSLAPYEKDVPPYDALSGRTAAKNIFIAGDATAQLPLLHEAADEGRIAGENAALYPDFYRRVRRTPIGIVFSDPQIAVVGASHAALLSDRTTDFAVAEVSFEDQGRARVMGVNKGLLRVYAENGTGRFLGAEMFGPAAEHIAHLLAWTIEAGMTVEQILQMPFYHPVIEEGVRTAFRHLAEALGGQANPPLRCMERDAASRPLSVTAPVAAMLPAATEIRA